MSAQHWWYFQTESKETTLAHVGSKIPNLQPSPSILIFNISVWVLGILIIIFIIILIIILIIIIIIIIVLIFTISMTRSKSVA